MYSICIVDDREIFRRQFKRFALFRSNEDFQVKWRQNNLFPHRLEFIQKSAKDL